VIASVEAGLERRTARVDGAWLEIRLRRREVDHHHAVDAVRSLEGVDVSVQGGDLLAMRRHLHGVVALDVRRVVAMKDPGPRDDGFELVFDLVE
jgi:hypothetical protein